MIPSDLRAKIRAKLNVLYRVEWEDQEEIISAVMEVLEDEGLVEAPRGQIVATPMTDPGDITLYYDPEPYDLAEATRYPTPEEMVGVKIIDATGKVIATVGPIIERPDPFLATFKINPPDPDDPDLRIVTS